MDFGLSEEQELLVETVRGFVANECPPTRLREIFDDMRDHKLGGRDFRHLSMGMTQDYQVAVEEGATILRIGTALFE